MKKKYILAIMIALAMGMTACSGVIVESETVTTESLKTEPIETEPAETEPTETEPTEIESTETEALKDDKEEYSDIMEIPQGDPIVGIVEKYADGIIVIKDCNDEDLIYYFSTQNAQIIEGDSPIAIGENVEITYRGVMGDEEHPGMAVKVVAASMMYNTERDDK